MPSFSFASLLPASRAPRPASDQAGPVASASAPAPRPAPPNKLERSLGAPRLVDKLGFRAFDCLRAPVERRRSVKRLADDCRRVVDWDAQRPEDRARYYSWMAGHFAHKHALTETEAAPGGPLDQLLAAHFPIDPAFLQEQRRKGELEREVVRLSELSDDLQQQVLVRDEQLEEAEQVRSRDQERMSQRHRGLSRELQQLQGELAKERQAKLQASDYLLSGRELAARLSGEFSQFAAFLDSAPYGSEPSERQRPQSWYGSMPVPMPVAHDRPLSFHPGIAAAPRPLSWLPPRSQADNRLSGLGEGVSAAPEAGPSQASRPGVPLPNE